MQGDQSLKVEWTAVKSWKRTLFIMVFAQSMTAVGFSSIFPFLPKYVEDLGSASGMSIELLAGLVISSQAFTMMMASPIWGTLADRFGHKLMVERAMFGGSVILLMMAFVNSAEELVLLRAVQGLITGTVSAANTLVAATAPRDRTGYAMGLLEVGLGSGVALGPLLGGILADLLGYRASFYVTAALLFLSGILVWWGVEAKTNLQPFAKEKHQGLLASWKQVLALKGVLVSLTMRFISQLGRNMISPMLPFLVSLLMPGSNKVNTYTGMIVGVSAATTTLSASYLGRLGDRVGYSKVLITSMAAAALLFVVQGKATTVWHLLILQAFVGITMGGVLPAISALLARYIHRGQEGAAYGLDNSINSAGRAIAPMVGAQVSLWFGLRATFYSTGLVFLVASILAVLFLPKTAVDNGNNQQ